MSEDLSRPQAWNNGLLASSYVPLSDVPATSAPQVLSALVARPDRRLPRRGAGLAGSLRLYVASDERADARTIVASVLRAGGGSRRPNPTARRTRRSARPAGRDRRRRRIRCTDRRLARRHAHRDPRRRARAVARRRGLAAAAQPGTRAADDADNDELTWLDDEHYVPPNPRRSRARPRRSCSRCCWSSCRSCCSRSVTRSACRSR